jgi:ATP-dependent Clp protease ATP-binding subunit ClpC
MIELGDCSGVDILATIAADLGSLTQCLQARLDSIAESNDDINHNDITMSPKTQKILVNLRVAAESYDWPRLGTDHLLYGIVEFSLKNPESNVFMMSGIDTEVITSTVRSKYKKPPATPAGLDRALPSKRSRSRRRERDDKSMLGEYSTDLTLQAATGKLDPVIGREDEIDRIIQVLLRCTKNNPVLIGEAGVGKTAVIEALAQRISEGQVPDKLITKKIYSLDLTSVIAGTKYRGEFEERLKSIIDEAAADEDCIIFIDELHTIVGTGNSEGSLDVSNILKPKLARSQITCIGATTNDEYREYIETDSALERRFQPISVHEPTPEETEIILRGIKTKFETYHNVKYSIKTLKSVVSLADRYITDRNFPDKAIDIMDEIGAKIRATVFKECIFDDDVHNLIDDLESKKLAARKDKDIELAEKYKEEQNALYNKYYDAYSEWLKLQKKSIKVTEADVSEYISSITGIPVTKLQMQESSRLKRLRRYLNRKVIGQPQAVTGITDTIKRSRAGLNDPNKPISSFLFLGTTGVGKTYTAKVLCEYLFDSRDSIVQVNMSEYMESHSVSRLIGPPPGYVGYGEGGMLTEPVRRNPYSVILFDELEKAHPDVIQLLLQLLEEGTLTDSLGNTVNFKNTIIIMTSNIGAEKFVKDTTIGFGNTTNEDIADKVKLEVKQYLKPELINRIDDIIVFNLLKDEDLVKISKLLLKDVVARLRNNKIKIEFTDDVYEFLINKRDNLKYGARPIKRVITKYIENKLADVIISNNKVTIKALKVSVKSDSPHVKIVDSAPIHIQQD